MILLAYFNTLMFPLAHRRSWFVLRSRATIAIVRDYLLIVDKLTFIEIFGDSMIKSRVDAAFKF